MARIARHVRLTGRVQGVFFRAWSREKAESLKVSGWIRNCPDGRVEAHVEGDQSAVETMIGHLKKGPRGARVEDIRLWDADLCDFEGFEVRH